MEDKFIVTQDQQVAEELEKSGLFKLYDNGKTYTFINPGNMIFSNITKGKIAYTNIIPI